MSLTTITINSMDYPSYATIAEADTYLAIDLARSEAWSTLDEAGKGQRLAAVTRRMDGLRWIGRRASETQATAWPRLDMTPTPSAPIPPELEQATILLAGDLTVDPSGAPASASAASGGIQSERIGPKAVTYFSRRQARTAANTPIADTSALALVRQWLEASSIASPVATGTDAQSEFVPRGRYGRTEGIG